MTDIVADFELQPQPQIDADFDLQEEPQMSASFTLTSGTIYHDFLLHRDYSNQHPISAITDLQDSLDTLQQNIDNEAETRENADEGLNEDIIAENERALEAEEALGDRIDDIVDGTTDISYDNSVSGLEATTVKGALDELQSNIESEHSDMSYEIYRVEGLISDEETRAKGVEGDLSDLTTTDNTDLVSAINELNSNKVDKVNTASRVYGTDSNGDQTTYDVDSFGKVDDVKVNGTSVVTNKIANLGSMAGETASDYVTVATTQTITGAKDFTQINNVNGRSLAAYNSIQSTNDIGNTGENLRLQGSGQRPRYRDGNTTSYLALYSDIEDAALSAGTGIDITSKVVSVTAPTVINNATGTNSVALGDSSQSTAEGSVALGKSSKANSTYSTAIGYNAQATNTNSVAIGKQAKATAARTVAIGSGAEANADDAYVIKGINNTANTFQVGTYTLLDTSTGLIPDARISTNIARSADVEAIEELIPVQASTSNQLADKDFVNSSIASNTANFIGTFANVSALEAYAGTVTNNDYAFVVNSVVTDNGNDWADFATLDAYDKSLLTNFDYAWVVNGANFDLYRFDVVNQAWDLRESNVSKSSVTLNTAYNRYKATVSGGTTTWAWEYMLNNSSFTASQWLSINSGATPAKINQIGTNTNDISTINTTIGGYGDIVTHDVSEFATAAQGSLADTAVQPADLATVATSGSYTDLLDKPTIGNATLTIQKNGTSINTFTANATSDVTVNVSVPTDTSDLTNGAGYITGITSSDVTTALGYTPYDDTNPDGFISGITSSDVTTALGYTPYDSSNPAGYTTNTGTVTSVNNVSPVSGDVTLTASDVGALSSSTKYGSDLSYSSNSLQLLDQDGNSLGNPVTIQSSPALDNKSITKNASDQLQTIGVINQNDTTTAIKTWTGTRQQYDAIVTKDANTLYNITDDTSVSLTILEALYPVGSIYITTNAACPLSTLIAGSTWVQETSRVLVDKKEPTDNDPTWYNLYSDGWCDQGGQVSYLDGSGFMTVTYLKPYINEPNVVVTQKGSYYNSYYSGQHTDNVQVSTPTYCTIYVDSNIPYRNWRACGYTSATTSHKQFRRTA